MVKRYKADLFPYGMKLDLDGSKTFPLGMKLDPVIFSIWLKPFEETILKVGLKPDPIEN